MDFQNRGWIDKNTRENTPFQEYFVNATSSWGMMINSQEQLAVKVVADAEANRAGGTFNNCELKGEDNSQPPLSIFDPCPLTKVLTGSSVGPFEFDMIITIDPQYAEDNYWLDPTTLTPDDKTDFLWIVMHEFGHALGFAGTRNIIDGTFNGDFINTFDSLSSFTGDEANFEGDKASALFEGPVPLTFLTKFLPPWRLQLTPDCQG